MRSIIFRTLPRVLAAQRRRHDASLARAPGVPCSCVGTSSSVATEASKFICPRGSATTIPAWTVWKQSLFHDPKVRQEVRTPKGLFYLELLLLIRHPSFGTPFTRTTMQGLHCLLAKTLTVSSLGKPSSEDTARTLGVDYFDLFLIHFPIPLAYVDPKHRYPPE